MLLFLSVLFAPILGPALYALFHGKDRAVRAVDTFVYIAVPALVAWQVLPFALERRSVLILFVAGAGLILPAVFERVSRSLEAHTDNLAIIIGLSGLVLHTLLEGAAFAPWGTEVDPAFAMAVVVHRIPVGLVLWWLLQPRHGTNVAMAGIALLIGGTLLGFVVGSEVLGPADGHGSELYQAFVSGSLIHVVFHQGRGDHAHDGHGHAGHADSGRTD